MWGDLAESRYRVVVADDVAEVRNLLRRCLEETERFVVVSEAADGNQALAAVRTQRPDLVVLDLSMPNRGGLEILSELRGEPEPPVVAVFSSIGPDILGAAVTQGAHLYSPKETPIIEFVAQLLREMDLRQKQNTLS